MGAGRFWVIAIALCVFSFATTKWLFAVSPMNPDSRIPSFHRVDPDSPRTKVEASHASDMDVVRDGLRHAVLDSAESLSEAPCNDVIKARYVKAVTDYTRAWFSITPCLATRRCSSADGPLIERAQAAFGSPLDHRAREAMKRAHETDAMREGDFPKDVVRFVAELAADPMINSAADPEQKKLILGMRPPLNCQAAMR